MENKISCNHCWIFYSCIYPKDRVEMWWSCKRCGKDINLLILKDTPQARARALTSKKAIGDCDAD